MAKWLHIGAGNIFRGYITSIAQKMIDEGLTNTGIIACELYDEEIIEKVFTPYDNKVTYIELGADGSVHKQELTAIDETVGCGDTARLREIFAAPSLQIISFTITEKGYAPYTLTGKRNQALLTVTEMLYERYKNGAFPITLLSLDNCAKNGDKLRDGILELAKDFNDAGFISYLNGSSVGYPWSMIDKITPNPSPGLVEGMKIYKTTKNTVIAPFVNAEKPGYLVIEDNFPNGRPPLDKAGVYITNRDTVGKVERMKVTTCLNPLHTAMAVFGCLLGFTKISDMMSDADILKLVNRLGYSEGLPVVTDPGIINPRAFLNEVIEERLPNPHLPDTPQRIATDTSQKVGIRFGETIKGYIENGLPLDNLLAVPLTIATWLRYLQGADDLGDIMPLSPDPRLAELQEKVKTGRISEILSDTTIFGLDLTKTELADRINGYYEEMCGNAGTVRQVLRHNL